MGASEGDFGTDSDFTVLLDATFLIQGHDALSTCFSVFYDYSAIPQDPAALLLKGL
jgi:hypothetical protein